jgi:hypothetical protein
LFDTVNTFMDINELESFKLSDAVKFNKTLNPRLWGRDEHLLPEVREKLMAIADDFREFLGVNGLDVKDITVSGSNAAYTYTPHSDVDLHLVVAMPEGKNGDVYRELFDAKKYQYNDQHNYKIGGYDVELYVQDADKTHHSQGIYSVLNNDWVSVPRRRRPEVDDISVQSKFEDIGHRIEQAIASGDPEQMAAISAKVKNMRQSGLDTTGEFGAENLAFKALRTQGLLDQLRTARNAVKDQELSLQERKKKRSQRGYGGYWYPGFSFGDSEGAGDGGGGESVRENTKSPDIKQVLQPFIDSCVEYLGIEQAPKIVLKRDPEWTRRNGTFGSYDHDTRSVTLAVSNRHTLDILRTLAHELTHARQDEQAELPVDAGKTGSPYEDEANAMAGRIMRHWVDQYPEFFKDIPLDEDYDPNGTPPGPETKPTMPAGTVRVDVSDVYDWYKLGQHISNLDGLGKHDFGAGPPGAIFSFGSEEQEHKYIDALKKTGLTTTDLDPVDPNQPPGMARQKTDPTYNVDEAEMDEASLATMRDYFAGDEKARDPYEITKQRVHFSRDPGANAAMQKRFKSPAEYEAWLKTKNALQVKLKESLDQPYKILRWEKGDYGDVDAIARLPDGTFLSVMFTKGFSQETKEEAWSVEFFRNNSQEKTGEGDQQRVFATVLSAVQTFVSDRVPGAKGRYKPNKIFFSASKEVKPDEDQRKAMTRARLYDSLVQRYARALGFRAFRADTGKQVMYELSRIKPVVAEATGYIPVNDKEARDPRYSMAITQDIKPGEVQRQARKMGWTTDAAGRPPLLTSNASNLRESQDSHMKIAHILKEATLGGFPVKVLNIQDQGVNEFALPGGDDREPDEEHILRQLAAQWWNGTEQQMARAQKTLAAMGWDIGQDESGDDDAGVFVIRVGDENGDSYIAFNHSELALDEARNSYHANRTGFRPGARDPEGQDAPVSQQVWGLKINGKVWSKQGKDVTFTSKQAAINTMNAILKNRPDLQGKIGLVTRGGVSEAIKLNAPQRTIPRDELQGYADRIKSGTKTKRDKFAPIIHGSNIRAITKDDENTEWDLDDLSRQITTRPKAILGTNAKMEKSKTEGEIIYDLTLPALSGIVVDEESGDFVEITTCPGAGACQLFCYARKGGYVMFPASSMSAAQALNFLVNDPEGYSARVNQEIKAVKAKADKAGIQLVVRWHDAGDFFSKEYLDLAYDVAKSNPDVQFYAYTKMGDVATGSAPANFTMNFSSGSKRGEEKKVEFYKQQNPGATVKQGVTVPKNMFFDLIARNGNSLIKDAKGRTQFASPEALGTFKQRIAQQYKVAPDSIITYDQMLATPVGPTPKWNVIVQPGAGDRAANRKDVIDSYLMFH